MVNYFFFLCISYITFNSFIGSHFCVVWHLNWDLSFLLVRVCNCTKLGYCYMEPETHSWKLGMSSTIGILAGIFGFISKTDMLELVLLCLYLNTKQAHWVWIFFFFFSPVLFLAIVIYRIKKKDQRRAAAGGETESKAML